jgi:hypothetical protein
MLENSLPHFIFLPQTLSDLPAEALTQAGAILQPLAIKCLEPFAFCLSQFVNP